jgi:hypothetical protein
MQRVNSQQSMAAELVQWSSSSTEAESRRECPSLVLPHSTTHGRGALSRLLPVDSHTYIPTDATNTTHYVPHLKLGFPCILGNP